MENPKQISNDKRPVIVSLRAILVASRPKQWTKNVLLYFVLFFTAGDVWVLNDTASFLSLFGKATTGFVLFSLVSSSQYLINDILDAERDRKHADKRHRPVASGDLSSAFALTGAVVLGTAGITSAFIVEIAFGWVATVYLAISLAYSLVLKQIVLIDVFAISAGFVLRAVAGAAVLQVPVSPWLYICTGLGALFLGLSKRRSELVNAGETAGSQREALYQYSVPLLDQLIGVVATATPLSYILYTFTAPNLPDNDAMMLTAPFVVYGVFRYLFLVYAKNIGESPEDVVITDGPLIVSIALWLATSATVLLYQA
jgi:4-hydroxybenzoate polyprenyltransferase